MRGVGMYQWRTFLCVSTLFAVIVSGVQAQDKPQTPAPATVKRSVTVSDAVEIFMRQNLELVAARYDIETADAEKLTARLRPNPQLTFGLSNLPVNLSGPIIQEQTYSYGLSHTIELGGKRNKRIDVADANADVAR